MSERLREQLTTQIIASIRRMTDEELGQLIRSQCADEAALRAECERLKARVLPNLDAMRFDQLETIGNDLDRLNAYFGSRMNLLATDPKYKPMIEKRLESYYSKIESPWAKFREE